MITTEMIDKVMQVTGKDYFTIKEALERNAEDVKLTIEELSDGKDVNLEDTYEYKGKKLNVSTSDIINTIKEIWDEGNASYFVIEKDGKEYFRFNLAISGILLAITSHISLLGLGVAILANYTIKVEMKDGKVININEETLKKKFEEVKDDIIGKDK